ncbi:MAG: CofH family radical SAM protein [Desulfobacterales bacterium]|jgi:cyclic dehypoxanthinyl futalosine synthase|nr:CofH family radical SAM protein [Desulfobacteraceae bacterium]MBT7084576.1 CofH family radical SAM protein [Desulfobacterales bacterium]MBT7696981.1 CofH family radical SAM protein [Desulfobacterales bacterium]
MENRLKRKIYDGGRITAEEALELYSWDFIDLAKAGDMRRGLVFPQEEVGFIIDRIINFTNICEASCSFCAFHARADHIEAYSLSIHEICEKVQELVDAGGSQVMLQGGLHPDYTFDTYLEMVRTIKKKFPKIFLHSFSPAELAHISRKNNITLDEIVKSLKEAGLDSVPGASDLLVERIRKKVSPKKITVTQWCEVMNTLCIYGMKSSATMTYGMGETSAEQIEHLRVIRNVQDQTGIIRAFIPWSFSPARTGLEYITPATGIEYLKIVAIGRIFLDNIIYIQAGWLTEGMKLAQIALTSGANDMGGVLMEEVVVKATGIETMTNMDELVEIIRNAGKIPVKRDSGYNIIRKYS